MPVEGRACQLEMKSRLVAKQEPKLGDQDWASAVSQVSYGWHLGSGMNHRIKPPLFHILADDTKDLDQDRLERLPGLSARVGEWSGQ